MADPDTIPTLEHDVALDCHKLAKWAAPPPVGADIAWYWSEWFHHAALVLALLYEQRAEEGGDDVRTWLRRIADAEGDNAMAPKIELILSRRAPFKGTDGIMRP